MISEPTAAGFSVSNDPVERWKKLRKPFVFHMYSKVCLTPLGRVMTRLHGHAVGSAVALSRLGRRFLRLRSTAAQRLDPCFAGFDALFLVNRPDGGGVVFQVVPRT